jgi:ACT domain-containing protein
MRAFVTVIGHDRVGIIAGICGLLAEKSVNILDISQTILQDNFTMIMLVDAAGCTVSFEELAARLSELGKSMELDIRIQREEIFNAMHKI